MINDMLDRLFHLFHWSLEKIITWPMVNGQWPWLLTKYPFLNSKLQFWKRVKSSCHRASIFFINTKEAGQDLHRKAIYKDQLVIQTIEMQKNVRNPGVEFRQHRSEGPAWAGPCAWAMCFLRSAWKKGHIFFTTHSYLILLLSFFSGWTIWSFFIEDRCTACS